MKLVSVIVPTYRRESDLERALFSLADQTYSDVETVVIDDNGNGEWNSKVKTIVDRVLEKYPDMNLKLIVNSPNRGSAKSRNIGIEQSSGEYVTFLDDDDVYLPEKVEKHIAFMTDGGYDYSITDLYLYDKNDTLVDKRVRSYVSDTSAESLLLYHLKYNMTGTDSMMFRKEYLVRIGGFAPIDVGDEYYLMQRAIDGGGKFGYLQGCDIKAYVHMDDSGLSGGEGKISGENALYEYKKKFFEKIDKKTVRYIRMRHFAVLAFANLKMSHYIRFLTMSLKSFACAPVECIKLFLGRKKLA